MKNLFVFLSVSLLLSINFSHAYVENTTGGYANCMSCHYSPAGGDLLNDYGRALSKEYMSTWEVGKHAEQPLFGLVKESKWARLGGDVRTVQTYIDNPFVESGQLFLMQSNIELGLKHKFLMFVGALGFRGGPSASPINGEVISERHYALADLSAQTKLRLGKFKTIFGINDPNHTRQTKQLLGFGRYSETYNLELFHFTESWELSGNFSAGRLDGRGGKERSFSTNFTHYLSGSTRLSLSLFLGDHENQSRTVVSQSGVIPLNKKFYTMYEIDYQTVNGDAPVGARSFNDLLAGYARLGYKVFKGLQAYISYEYAEKNIDLPESRSFAPGFGAQWFPIPHFELQLEVQKVKDKTSGVSTTAGFLQGHYYF